MVERFFALIGRFGFIFLLLAFWLGFSPAITMETVLIGLFLSIVIKKASDYLFQDIYRISIDFRFVLGFFAYGKNLIVNIFKSAFSMIPLIVYKKDQPVIFNVHLSTSHPLVVTLVANAITLTPGTLTLEISEDNVLSVLSIQGSAEDLETMARDIVDAYEKPFPFFYRKDVL